MTVSLSLLLVCGDYRQACTTLFSFFIVSFILPWCLHSVSDLFCCFFHPVTLLFQALDFSLRLEFEPCEFYTISILAFVVVFKETCIPVSRQAVKLLFLFEAGYYYVVRLTKNFSAPVVFLH